MTTIEYQDSDIIILYPYTFTGERDMYVRQLHPFWSQSSPSDYKLLVDRVTRKVLQASNEYYLAKYAAIESSLIGDVLILGGGLQTLDAFLVTGTNWKWVEINSYLASIVPANGTMHEGDANDLDFLATLGTFDTILVDFPVNNSLTDYSSLLNPGGTVIYFTL